MVSGPVGTAVPGGVGSGAVDAEVAAAPGAVFRGAGVLLFDVRFWAGPALFAGVLDDATAAVWVFGAGASGIGLRMDWMVNGMGTACCGAR